MASFWTRERLILTAAALPCARRLSLLTIALLGASAAGSHDNNGGVFVWPSVQEDKSWPSDARQLLLNSSKSGEARDRIDQQLDRFVVPVQKHKTKLFDSDKFNGFDITKPYPGAPVDGWEAHIRVVPDVPYPDFGGDSKDKVTTVSALTISPPDALFPGGQDVMNAIDPSWHICQYYFADRASPAVVKRSRKQTHAHDHHNHHHHDHEHERVSDPAQTDSCTALLSNPCRTGVQELYGGGFGFRQYTSRRCFLPGDDTDDGPSHSALPAACTPKGQKQQHLVLPVFMSADRFDNVARPSYFTRGGRLKRDVAAYGTGWNNPGNETALGVTGDTTWLVVTVWGHNVRDKDAPVPQTSVSCLRARDAPPEGVDQESTAGQTKDTSFQWGYMFAALGFIAVHMFISI